MAPRHGSVIEPLNELERYATASLFMVSLRETLWEAVAWPGTAQKGLWGPGGLCRVICAQLDIPERTWETLERASYVDLSDTIPSLVDALDTPAPGEEAAAAADEASRLLAVAAAHRADAERQAAAAVAAASAAEAAIAAEAAAKSQPDWHPLSGSSPARHSPPARAAPLAAEVAASASLPPALPAGVEFGDSLEADARRRAEAPARRPQDCFSLLGDDEPAPPRPAPAAVVSADPLGAHVAMEPLELEEEAGPEAPTPEFDDPLPEFDDPLRQAAAEGGSSASAPPPPAAAPPDPAADGGEGFGTSELYSSLAAEIARDAARRLSAGPRPPPPKRRCRRADVVLRELLKVLAGRPGECYDARCRVALRRTARHLRMSKSDVTALEAEVGGGALEQISLWPRFMVEPTGEEGEAAEGKGVIAAGSTAWLAAPMEAARCDPDGSTVLETHASRRTYKVYAAAAAGAGLLALTGGLAAPAILAGAAAVLPAGAVALGGGAGLAAGAALTGGLSVAGGSIAARSMANRTAALREFSFAPIVNDADGAPAVSHARLALTICCSGWLGDPEDTTRPWEPLSAVDAERVAVVWETAELLNLGAAMKSAVTDVGMAEVVKHGAMHTVLQGFLSAVALPATMLTAASLIDNSWARCCDRADQAATLLAVALMEGSWYGRRPVTLLGYSLGARVVFGALQKLADAGVCGVVETLVLFGAAVPSEPAEWDRIRQVVAGRLVNVYSENDWLLGLAYRSNSISSAAAGLRPVPAEGVENVDASLIIKRHTQYSRDLPQLLRHISTSHLTAPRTVHSPAGMTFW